MSGLQWRRLAGGLTCLAAVMALFAVLVLTGPGQRLDHQWMVAATEGSPRLHAWAQSFTTVLVPMLVAAALATLALTMAGHRRGASMLAAALVTVVPVVLAEGLKVFLPRPVLGDLVLHNSFPSGTVAAVTAVLTATVVSTPSRWRLFTAGLAAPAVAGAAVSVVVLGWHRPSDVLGALLLVEGVALVVTAFRRAPSTARHLRETGTRLQAPHGAGARQTAGTMHAPTTLVNTGAPPRPW